ncbi:hypothetical protein ACCO45_007347 [Purpureocillium lilacinum]|uniref:Uncharacterized protein n=1 Tax=Purpureocillium lilacinum TaxID=33203 RepID=A0ACC4DS43_PURLI
MSHLASRIAHVGSVAGAAGVSRRGTGRRGTRIRATVCEASPRITQHHALRSTLRRQAGFKARWQRLPSPAGQSWRKAAPGPVLTGARLFLPAVPVAFSGLVRQASQSPSRTFPVCQYSLSTAQNEQGTNNIRTLPFNALPGKHDSRTKTPPPAPMSPNQPVPRSSSGDNTPVIQFCLFHSHLQSSSATVDSSPAPVRRLQKNHGQPETT